MACQCGTSTASQTDESQAASSGCGCGTGAGEGCGCGTGPVEGQSVDAPESLDVAALARLVKDLEQRVRELEMETSRT